MKNRLQPLFKHINVNLCVTKCLNHTFPFKFQFCGSLAFWCQSGSESGSGFPRSWSGFGSTKLCQGLCIFDAVPLSVSTRLICIRIYWKCTHFPYAFAGLKLQFLFPNKTCFASEWSRSGLTKIRYIFDSALCSVFLRAFNIFLLTSKKNAEQTCRDSSCCCLPCMACAALHWWSTTVWPRGYCSFPLISLLTEWQGGGGSAWRQGEFPMTARLADATLFSSFNCSLSPMGEVRTTDLLSVKEIVSQD
jgi:hypothetical protein